MDKNNQKRYFFLITFALIILISYVLIKPYITAVLAAFILTYLFYPLYRKLGILIRNRSLRSIITVILVILIILIPSLFITNALINQSVKFYHSIGKIDVSFISNIVSKYVGENIDIEFYFRDIVNKAVSFVLTSLSNFVLSLPQRIIALFVMLFSMYYFLKEGNRIIEKVKEILPLREKHKDDLINKVNDVMYAGVYGIILTAVLQGIIGTIGLIIFKVQSPILWGITLTIAATLPYIGSSIVWLPIALIKIFSNDLFNGIGLLIYGILIISFIDNLVRPKIVSEKSQIHPVVILLGILGGLKFFGFVGIIIGPIVLAILLVFLEEYLIEHDIKSKKS